MCLLVALLTCRTTVMGVKEASRRYQGGLADRAYEGPAPRGAVHRLDPAGTGHLGPGVCHGPGVDRAGADGARFGGVGRDVEADPPSDVLCARDGSGFRAGGGGAGEEVLGAGGRVGDRVGVELAVP
ncbi:hypothetical protein DFJ73DRAFT_824661 [Zopfochytrium polystomum]|nr:hypothetical protein DFJ73DRAFT_824661 [Zopfochytrium polystomum]